MVLKLMHLMNPILKDLLIDFLTLKNLKLKTANHGKSRKISKQYVKNPFQKIVKNEK